MLVRGKRILVIGREAKVWADALQSNGPNAADRVEVRGSPKHVFPGVVRVGYPAIPKVYDCSGQRRPDSGKDGELVPRRRVGVYGADYHAACRSIGFAPGQGELKVCNEQHDNGEDQSTDRNLASLNR